MNKELKIVFYILLIYGILSIQFLFEQGVFIIPYMFNPLVIFVVSLAMIFTTYKKNNFSVNLIYFIGVTVYCFTSERTLNLIFNYTKIDWYINIIENPYLRLISILGYSIPLVTILLRYSLQVTKEGYISFGLLLISVIIGLIGYYDIIYVIGFSLFAISFLVVNFNLKDNQIKSSYFPLIYQLILFTTLEDVFFILA
jgi:hypothetical protein